MKLTAIATEDFKSKGLEGIPIEMVLTVDDDLAGIPDTYGLCIGRFDETSGKYESYFACDEKAGTTEEFDKCRKKCNVIEQHKTVINTETCERRPVVDYYLMYNIKESSKNRPTEIQNHVEQGICLNGHFQCEYELLFTCDSATRRIVVKYNSCNVPMYAFMEELEDEIEEMLDGDADETNIFFQILTKRGCWCAITMYDAMGNDCKVEISKASELMAMLVSVRQLSCEFVENM